jgi:hypothetical protein
MWIFALEGFVSVVAVRGSEDQLLVRGRVREDVEHWKRLVGKGRIKNTPHADYPWRFVTTRERFAQALAKMVAEGLQYDNFKSAVGHDDLPRARAYMDVWATMARLG